MLVADIDRTPSRIEDRREALALRADGLARRYPRLPTAHVRLWNEHPVVTREADRLWLVSPIDRDPLLGPGGPRVLPAAPRRQLRRWSNDGPPFDAVVVAHELVLDEPLRSFVAEQVRDAPRTCDDALARLLVGPTPAHPAVTRAAAFLDDLAQRHLRHVAARAVDALVDPVVFGIVAPPRPEHGAPALWYGLTAWWW